MSARALRSSATAIVSILCFVPPAWVGAAGAAARRVHVTGHGVDLISGALVHSTHRSGATEIRVSTAIVELEGDLHGRVLYQVTTRIDTAHHAMTNTGRQVYSGTIRESEPVMLYDDDFRFEGDLARGTDHGTVRLVHPLGAPVVSCTLDVSGTGKTAAGDPTFTYDGECVYG
jgi:hypothetical protein